MSEHRDFDRAMHDWLETGSDRTPSRAIEAVLLAVKTTPQERDLRIPRRFTPMTTTMRLAAGIAIVAVAGVAVLTLFNRSPAPSAASPSTPPPSAPATIAPSPTPIDPATWVPFTSARNGISTRFPSDWAVTAATEPWIWRPNDPGATDHATDRAVAPNRAAFIIASQLIPAGMDDGTWWADFLAPGPQGNPAECFPATQGGFRTVSIEGRTAFVHGGLAPCNFTEAIVLVGGRAYVLTAFVNIDVVSGRVFDEALFNAWLSTVHFDPASADDTPVASPSSAP
jgi:hypothetical protein